MVRWMASCSSPTSNNAWYRHSSLTISSADNLACHKVAAQILDEFPSRERGAEATATLELLERTAEAVLQTEEKKPADIEAWATGAARGDIAELQAFLQDWPDGAHAADTKARLQELREKEFLRMTVWISSRIFPYVG
jgi:hypothetical protein